MTERDDWYKRLLDIGPDHANDTSAIYTAILKDADDKNLVKIMPELIAPCPDESINHDDPANWVAVHAWRLLSRLHSAAGLENMLAVADHPDDHLAYAEFPASAVAAGPEAAEMLLPVVNDATLTDTRRILAVKALVECVGEYPELGETVINRLSALIQGSTDQGGDINGFAAEGLMTLKANCAELIEQAYMAGKIQVGAVRAVPLGAYFGFET